MPRTLVAPKRYSSAQLSPGVSLERFYPGGRLGPHCEVLFDTPGGQVWSEIISLGDEGDSFQLSIPDIRLPANQLWPLHWHDCWVGIVILEGTCLIGDWWMSEGDVMITAAGVEYGPLLIGPRGCRMFEIFARLHLQAGGYGQEYRDHPTLQGGAVPFKFRERSEVNRRNEGRSTLPVDHVKGLSKSRLAAGNQWDLGERDDPERGVMSVARLEPGARLPTHQYADWHSILVMDGSMRIGGHTLGKDEFLMIRPNSPVGQIEAGVDGVKVLEVSRTARGSERRPVA